MWRRRKRKRIHLPAKADICRPRKPIVHIIQSLDLDQTTRPATLRSFHICIFTYLHWPLNDRASNTCSECFLQTIQPLHARPGQVAIPKTFLYDLTPLSSIGECIHARGHAIPGRNPQSQNSQLSSANLTGESNLDRKCVLGNLSLHFNACPNAWGRRPWYSAIKCGNLIMITTSSKRWISGWRLSAYSSKRSSQWCSCTPVFHVPHGFSLWCLSLPFATVVMLPSLCQWR